MASISKRSALVGYVAIWVILAALSVWRYPAIMLGQCAFQTSNWLTCTGELGGWAKAGLVLGYLAVFGGFLVIGRILWKDVGIEQGIPRTLRRWLLSLTALAVLMVPLGTTDWAYYFSIGKALSSGLNPYVDTWTLSIDYAIPAIKMPITGFSYGPLTAHLFDGIYRLAQGNALVFLLLWKLIMALTLWVTGWVILKLAKQLSNSAVMAEKVFWLAQPLLLFEWVVNGHFDGLWLLSLLGTMWAANTKRWWLVLPILSIGVWIKFIPILVAPFFILWWWQELKKDTWKKMSGQMLVGIGLAAGITIVGWAPYWVGTEVFSSIIIQSKWAVSSVFAVLYYSLKPLFQMVFGNQAHLYLTSLTQGSLLLLFVAALWPLITRGWKIFLKKEQWSGVQYVQAIFIFLLAYLLLWQKSFWPWYGIWFVPLGLVLYWVKPDRTILRLTAWFATAPWIHHILCLVGTILLKRDAAADLWFYWSMVLGIFGYPLYLLWQWRKKNYGLYS